MQDRGEAVGAKRFNSITSLPQKSSVCDDSELSRINASGVGDHFAVGAIPCWNGLMQASIQDHVWN